MPQIPAPDAPSVNPVGGAMPYQNISVDANMFGAGVGEAAKGLGSQIARVGDVLEKHAITMQNQQDEATNNTAVTAAIQAEGEITNRFQQLSGKQAQDALPQYYKDLEDARQKIRGDLPSDYVRKMYDQATMRQFGYAVVNGSRHAATQLRQYNNVAATSRLDNEVAAAVRNQDDNQFEESIKAENIKGILSTSDAKDLPPEKLDEIVRQKQQSAYSERVRTTALAGQPERALQLLDKWKDKLDPLQAEQTRHEVVNSLLSRRSNDIATQRTTEGGTTPFHQLLRAGVETESSDPYNTTLDNGRWTGGPVNLTNMTIAEVRQLQDRMLSYPENRAKYKGIGSSAVGAPQIIGTTLQGLIDDGTVRPDQKFDEATQDKIIGVLAERRGGDVNALRQEWDGLKNVSPERINAAYAASFGGTRVKPGDRQNVIEGARTDAGLQAQALGLREDETARFMDMAQKATEAKYRNALAVRKDEENGRYTNLALTAMGSDPTGMTSPKTTEELFQANPALREEWQKADPATQIRVQNILNRNSKADYPATRDTIERTNELWGMSISTDPKVRDEFQKMDFAGEEIPKSDYRKLLKRQSSMKQTTEQESNINSAMSLLKTELNAAGIRPSSAKQFNQYRGALESELNIAQQSNAGKKLDPSQIETIGKKLLKDVVTEPGYLWDTSDKLFRAVPPDDFVKGLRAKWPAQNGPLTDDLIQRLFVRSQMAKK